MIEERSAGAIAFRGDPPRLLMIHDAYGRWTFPKGLLETGETARAAALRELREETGIDGRILAELGTVRYFYTRPDGEIVRKRVWWYLVQAGPGELQPQPGEVGAAGWVPAGEACARLAYENLQPVLDRALLALRALGAGLGQTPSFDASPGGCL